MRMGVLFRVRDFTLLKKCQEAGYTVRLRIDPLMKLEVVKEYYSRLINLIFNEYHLKPEVITLGSLRFNRGLISLCKARFPKSDLFNYDFIVERNDKERYRVKDRIKLYKVLLNQLKQNEIYYGNGALRIGFKAHEGEGKALGKGERRFLLLPCTSKRSIQDKSRKTWRILMDKLEIQRKIRKGENLHTEFKESMPDNESLAKSIVCLASTDGGHLIIGVNDSGDIIGVEDPDEAARKIDDVAFNRCEPPISILSETVDMDGTIVLVITIPKGEQRPYRTRSGRYYIRSGNRCRHASWQEVRRLYQTSESIYYDETPISAASLGNLDMDYFRYFLKNYLDISPEERLMESYFENLKVITHNKKPTLAGMLYFGVNPQRFIPYAKIIAAYIPGLDISTPPSDKKDLDGKIPDIIENSSKFLRLYIREEHRIKGFEPELYPEIPESVLREGIVNAVAHRDYTINASIRLFIFDDRVEIRTPGKLPNTVTVESMKMAGSHVLRNPTLYNLLYKSGMVTDIGSGVYRMIKLMREKLNREIGLKVTETEFILSISRA